ncbi:Triacylglycerol lipase protein [Dioscorea alata]|uniref:Triacylglycerol lipase protein n=1 Tax=Dioscorea alata TaxID=55571 RepID=A0ACB7TXS9_DIOAL|nr:Triacylglycerol lipase protein [Dioscorea alata]
MATGGIVEGIFWLGCTHWAYKRCTLSGDSDSHSWSLTSISTFSPIPRITRAILSVYEPDLSNPQWPSSVPSPVSISSLSKRISYSQTHGHCPPYLIYIDTTNREIVVAIRGLHLLSNSDYSLLLDDRPGLQPLDSGYVHHGLFKAAVWLLSHEAPVLRRLLREHGPDFKLVLAGHSLGAGVASLATLLLVNHLDRFDGLPRSRVRCYAVAPPRCMSLNLAVKYADVINSVILQDDFLPRTSTPLQYMFGSIFCLPCLLCFVCMRDTFTSEEKKLKDPRRLYAPGRIFHIVDRKFCRCGRYPPEVRTAIQVEGRFEHIVLSCSTTSDHQIILIEREAQKALDRMKENEEANLAPMQQRMNRNQSFEEEHKHAMEKTMNLNEPHVEPLTEENSTSAMVNNAVSSHCNSNSTQEETDWEKLYEKLFECDDGLENNIVVKENENNIV